MIMQFISLNLIYEPNETNILKIMTLFKPNVYLSNSKEISLITCMRFVFKHDVINVFKYIQCVNLFIYSVYINTLSLIIFETIITHNLICKSL